MADQKIDCFHMHVYCRDVQQIIRVLQQCFCLQLIKKNNISFFKLTRVIDGRPPYFQRSNFRSPRSKIPNPLQSFRPEPPSVCSPLANDTAHQAINRQNGSM